MKYFYLFTLSAFLLFAHDHSFEYHGITVKQGKQNITVKRNIPSECHNKAWLTNQMMWSQDYAHSKVPQKCKSTYVSTAGKLQPIKIGHDVETYGELETLLFLKQLQTHSDMLFIDSRTEQWFNYMSIPGAVHIPFKHITDAKNFEFEFEDGLKLMGVKVENENKYDFRYVKTLLIFCNGAWCDQSPKMIHALIELGYPEDKIKWFRGGIQSWLAAGMTTIKK